MPSARITCMWEDNTTIDVREIGAFVNTTMKMKILWKAENFPFNICGLSTKSPFGFLVLP